MKLWRHLGFDAQTRKFTGSPERKQEGGLWQKPELESWDSPGVDYEEVERPTPATVLREKVLNDTERSYRVYKYATEDYASTIKETRLPPQGFDYKRQSLVLHPRNWIINAEGSLEYIEYWDYDPVTHSWVEITHRIWFKWVFTQNAPIKAAESPLYSERFAQFIKEDGNYELPYTIDEIIAGVPEATIDDVRSHKTDIRYTYKRFHQDSDHTKREYFLASAEGYRRRGNIMRIGEERTVTLIAALIASWDENVANQLGQALIRKYTDLLTEYRHTGDRSFVDQIASNGDANVLTDIQGVPILAGVSSNDILTEPIPATVNHPIHGTIPVDSLVPNASQVPDIRNFIVEKYKGEI